MGLKMFCLILLGIVSATHGQKSGDGYSCDFETGMCGLSNKEGNPVKWVRNQGGTPTPNTGPSTDHTKSNNQGYYAFVNAALLGNGGKTTMFTEKFSATSNSCLKFWYYMYGQHCGFLTISVADGKTGTSATIWKRWFDQGDGWILGQANIISKESYTIEFEVYNRIAINAFEGDVALDDIAIVSGSCEEIGDCDFDLDMCSWTNDAGNDFDWTRQKAGDITVGPRKDHTLSSENGYFVYLALQSSTGSDRESRLISQQFSSTDVNGRCLQFWYYTVGSTGTITIYADYGSTFPFEQPYWSLTGSSTNDWQRGFVPVVSEVDYKIIIEVATGNDRNGVVMIDDIRLTIGWCDISPQSAYPPVDTQSRPTAPPHVSTQYDCDFELGSLCSWTQSKTDHFDWKAIQAKSNGGHGPVIDQTRRTGNGWYIYIESEDQTVGDKAQLVSDVIPASDQSCVTFWYHIYGTHVNKLKVYTKAKDTTSRLPIWLREGGESDEWTFGYVSFSSADDFQLIFEAECGSSYHGDIALDGILYMNGECRFPEIHDMDCDFEDPFNRLCGWQQEKDDDFDFVVGTGATRIHHEIGPSIDHTTRTENGHFIYIDTTDHEKGEAASILSGKHEWRTSSVYKCWIFHYHHWLTTGTLSAYEQFDFKGKTYRKIYGWTVRRRGNNWGMGALTLKLYQHPNSPVQWAVKLYVGRDDKGDMAYDDFTVKEGPCYARGNEPFEEGLGTWLNEHDENMDKFDWLLASGDSVYGVSGPQVDHTLGTERGKYMLLDVSGGSAGYNAQLKSEELTYTYPRCFGFWYHMSGDNIGELRVSIRNMDTNDDTLLWKLNGPQTAGDAWKEGIVPLPKYPPAEIGQLVFEGIRGTGTHGDIAIDDTAMYTTPCDRVLPTEADPNTSSGNTGVIVGVVISFIMAITIVVVVIFIVVRRDELKV